MEPKCKAPPSGGLGGALRLRGREGGRRAAGLPTASRLGELEEAVEPAL